MRRTLIAVLAWLFASSASADIVVRGVQEDTTLTVVKPGDAANKAIRVNVVAGGSSASNTTASGTLAALNDAVQIAAAGQQGIGFQITASNLGGNIVTEYSMDGGTTWLGTGFYQLTGTMVSWSFRPGVLANPPASGYTIFPIAGATHYRVRCSSYSSGSATLTLTGTAANSVNFLTATSTVTGDAGLLKSNASGSLYVAADSGPGYFLVQQSTPASLRSQTASEANTGGSAPTVGGLATGKVTTAAPTYTNATHDALSLQTDGSLRVAVTSGGGSNASVGTTGAAVPGSATYSGMNVGGNLTGLTGTANGLTVDGPWAAAPTTSPPSRGLYLLGGVTTAAPSYTTGTVNALSLDTAGALRVTGSLGNNASVGTVGSAVPASATNLGAMNAGNLSNLTADASGNLNVNVAAGGGSGGTSSTFGAAFPGTGTAAGFKDSSGINMQPGNLDASGNLKVAIATSSPSGSLVVQQATGSNLHAVLDSGSTTAVTQATGTNLHTVVDSGTVTANAGTGTFTVSGTVDQGTATAGSGAWPVTVTEDTTNTVVKPGDATNKAIRVNVVAGGGSGGTSSTFSAAFPSTGTAAGFKSSGGTTMESANLDASGNLRVQAVQATGSNLHVVVDGNPVVTTASGKFDASSDIALGSASATNASVPAAYATSGAPTYTTGTFQVLSQNTSGGLRVDGSGVTQPISGTVTANAGTGTFNVSGSVTASGTVTANVGTTGGLALDSTLTGGTAKAITRGGAKGATAAADVTSTANGADHQGLDVQIQNASIPVTGTVTANAGTGTMTVGQATGTNLHVVVDSAPTTAVTGTFWQATQPVSISGNQAVNVAQINGITPLMGNGVTGTGSQRVTIASDNTPVAFKTDQTTHGTTDKVAADVTLVNGTAPTADNGTAGTTNLHVLPAIVETSSTMPTRTDGNRAALIVDAKGRLVTRISSTNPWSCAQSGITALTECKALTASTVHYVTHVVLSNGPTAQTLQIVYGTGTNCGTGQTALTSTIYLGVNGGAVIPFDSSPLAPASGNAICCKPSGTTAFSCTLAGYSE